jgi:2-dehydro-3-deoxy-L-rhamnonate dehydrogenase (NAD+)
VNAIDLKNRTAIITGGARGIGFAIAQRMLASGEIGDGLRVHAMRLGKEP